MLQVRAPAASPAGDWGRRAARQRTARQEQGNRVHAGTLHALLASCKPADSACSAFRVGALRCACRSALHSFAAPCSSGATCSCWSFTCGGTACGLPCSSGACRPKPSRTPSACERAVAIAGGMVSVGCHHKAHAKAHYQPASGHAIASILILGQPLSYGCPPSEAPLPPHLPTHLQVPPLPACGGAAHGPLRTGWAGPQVGGHPAILLPLWCFARGQDSITVWTVWARLAWTSGVDMHRFARAVVAA